jgi:ribonucleoside-triphosphate reductase
MKVIKRDGTVVDWCPEKVEHAINRANTEVEEEQQATPVQIKNIIKYIEKLGKQRILVEDIQDIIEMKLMSIGKYELAKHYITYRYTRELVRKSNTTDLAIKELIDGDNEYWNT